MTWKKPDRMSFGRLIYTPETPAMRKKFKRAMEEYWETGKISPDLPDLCVEEADGNYYSVKETAQQRISSLSGLLADVLETMPDGVSAAKLRAAIEELNDLPRLINREKQK